MHLELTAEQQSLQTQLRDYFAALVEEVEGAAAEEAAYTRYIRRMGEDGWLGLGWPVEYGGQARGPIDQMVFVEESHWAGVPLPLLTLNSVGPTLMALGSDEQKRRILPGIVRELDDRGVELAEFALRKASLDEVFLDLTGHSADEDDHDLEGSAR